MCSSARCKCGGARCVATFVCRFAAKMKCGLSLAVAVLVSILIQDVSSSGFVGGMSEEKPATAEIREIANEVRRYCYSVLSFF